MLKALIDTLFGPDLKSIQRKRKELNKRITKLEEATLDGENDWMLEKIKRKDSREKKRYRCDCEEI